MDKFILKQIDRNLINARLAYSSLENSLIEAINKYCEDYQVDKINVEGMNFTYESALGNEKILISYIEIDNNKKIYLSDKDNKHSLYFFEIPFYMQSEFVDKLFYYLK